MEREVRRQVDQTIELDCWPGAPRPGDLIGGVIAGTLLPARAPISRFFGCWCWDYNDVPVEAWNLLIQPVIKERIDRLYRRGEIRFGSW